MKNIKYVLGLLFIIILVFVFRNTILECLNIIFNKLIFFEKNYFFIFLICLLIINLINFLTPIPTFPIIIFNGFILKEYGFFFSYILIILCSYILYNSVKKLDFFLNTKFYSSTVSIINNYKNNDLNFFLISASRYVLPYFIHNIFFWFCIKKKQNFFIFSFDNRNSGSFYFE